MGIGNLQQSPATEFKGYVKGPMMWTGIGGGLGTTAGFEVSKNGLYAGAAAGIGFSGKDSSACKIGAKVGKKFELNDKLAFDLSGNVQYDIGLGKNKDELYMYYDTNAYDHTHDAVVNLAFDKREFKAGLGAALVVETDHPFLHKLSVGVETGYMHQSPSLKGSFNTTGQYTNQNGEPVTIQHQGKMDMGGRKAYITPTLSYEIGDSDFPVKLLVEGSTREINAGFKWTF